MFGKDSIESIPRDPRRPMKTWPEVGGQERNISRSMYKKISGLGGAKITITLKCTFSEHRIKIMISGGHYSIVKLYYSNTITMNNFAGLLQLYPKES